MSYDPLIQEPELMLEQSRGESPVKFVEDDCNRHEIAISTVVVRWVKFTLVGLDVISSVDVDSVGVWLFTTSAVDGSLEFIEIMVRVGLDIGDVWEDVNPVVIISFSEFKVFSRILK